jgi:hypothetical protein
LWLLDDELSDHIGIVAIAVDLDVGGLDTDCHDVAA